MTIKEFLERDQRINLTGIAKAMWPNNATAKTYLNHKLKGTCGKKWTKRDDDNAMRVLKDLGVDISKLS